MRGSCLLVVTWLSLVVLSGRALAGGDSACDNHACFNGVKQWCQGVCPFDPLNFGVRLSSTWSNPAEQQYLSFLSQAPVLGSSFRRLSKQSWEVQDPVKPLHEWDYSHKALALPTLAVARLPA